MFQKKASWWKEFDWVGGVMVELDWVSTRISTKLLYRLSTLPHMLAN
jgi:hypothetical protein